MADQQSSTPSTETPPQLEQTFCIQTASRFVMATDERVCVPESGDVHAQLLLLIRLLAPEESAELIITSLPGTKTILQRVCDMLMMQHMRQIQRR